MSRAALLAMAGSARGRGSSLPATTNPVSPSPSATGQGETGEAMTVTVKKSGGWFLPFAIGTVTGFGGAVALYKLVKEAKS